MPAITKPDSTATTSSNVSVRTPYSRRTRDDRVPEFQASSHHVMNLPIQVTGWPTRR